MVLSTSAGARAEGDAPAVVVLCDDMPALTAVADMLVPAATDAVHAFRACAPSDTAPAARLVRAREAFYALDFATADRALRAAAKQAVEGVVSRDDDLVPEIFGLMVWLDLETHASERASQDAERLVYLRPDVTVTAKSYPPHVVAAIERAKAARGSSEALAITTTPASRIAVDGVVRCSSPCVLHGVAAGRHRVAAIADGLPPHVGDIVFGPQKKVGIQLVADTRPELASALAANDEERLRLVREQSHGAASLIVLGEAPGSHAVRVSMVRSGEAVSTLDFVSGTASDTIVASIRAAMARPLAAETSPPPATPSPVHPEIMLAVALPVSEPQRDDFGVGGFLAARLALAVASRVELHAQLGALVLSGKRDATGVGFASHLAVGARARAFEHLAVEAHVGAALTSSLVRPWLDLGVTVPFRLGSHLLAPGMHYLRVLDAGGAARPGDASLLAAGATLLF